MLVKNIKYTDYDGNNREDTYYFNINNAELIELEASMPDGISNYINKITSDKNTKEIVLLFKNILRLAIGVKSEDGKRLKKSSDIADEFFESEAYSELMMEFISNESAAKDFISKVLPAK